MREKESIRKEKKRTKEKEMDRRKEKDIISESYRIDKDIRDTYKEIKNTNQENKNLATIHRPIETTTIIWIIIIILVLIIVGIEYTSEYQKITGKTIDQGSISQEESKETINLTATDQTREKTKTPTRQENYESLMLKSLKTDKKEYHRGEEANIEAEYKLKEKSIKATIEYRIKDPDGKTAFSYSEEATISRKNNRITKKTLIADNYKTGTYILETRTKFSIKKGQQNKTYVIPADISFKVIGRSKESILQRAGKSVSKMNFSYMIILSVLIIFNILLMYNTQRKR